ncbi:hypothetical protein B481_0671 [Planococcus halocryophilus Or1]|nr:hypothetical protein B481_0671 [Planococcus halocryophilus Or1]
MTEFSTYTDYLKATIGYTVREKSLRLAYSTGSSMNGLQA